MIQVYFIYFFQLSLKTILFERERERLFTPRQDKENKQTLTMGFIISKASTRIVTNNTRAPTSPVNQRFADETREQTDGTVIHLTGGPGRHHQTV